MTDSMCEDDEVSGYLSTALASNQLLASLTTVYEDTDITVL